MDILFLESFHGGSHRDFARAYSRESSHRVELLTLPARHWKWRQAGSALAFLEEMDTRGLAMGDFDRLILTDLTDLNLLKSLRKLPPVLLYMHESQFHYPLQEGERPDFHYGFKDFTNILAADEVVFNSAYHGEEFFRSCRDFLNRMPDFRPLGRLDAASRDWHRVYPGFSPPPMTFPRRVSPVPRLLWNHRWEHDKNPAGFYRFLRNIKDAGRPFRLILLGERFTRYPEEFDAILGEFSSEILSSEYAGTKEEYWETLFQADYVISTSLQENFGISTVEAIWAGAVPLLPRRLSYPEILPGAYHGLLYEDIADLTGKFLALCESPLENAGELSRAMERYCHKNSASSLDQILEGMA